MERSIRFRCGLRMNNPFILAPLTNHQCFSNGQLSPEEVRWLTMRAEGGFGMIMTCAAFVTLPGQGFPNQMGMSEHINGYPHREMNKRIHHEGALSLIQLHHAGARSPESIIGQTPVTPDNQTLDEVAGLRDAFIDAASRAQDYGYDGVQIHGAHGYLLAQFLSPTINQREDHYGGTLENRFRLIREILVGVRERCGSGFLVSLRLSPERFGMELAEVLSVGAEIYQSKLVDMLDWSLWDVFKQIEGNGLMDTISAIPRGDTVITMAGKIHSTRDCEDVLRFSDAISIGRGAILHHNFPKRALRDPKFVMEMLPVTTGYLKNEGLSPNFVQYMRNWKGFVA